MPIVNGASLPVSDADLHHLPHTLRDLNVSTNGGHQPPQRTRELLDLLFEDAGLLGQVQGLLVGVAQHVGTANMQERTESGRALREGLAQTADHVADLHSEYRRPADRFSRPARPT